MKLALLLSSPNLVALSLKAGALTCLETLDDLKFHAQQNLARIYQERESILLTVATGCLEGITILRGTVGRELQALLASPLWRMVLCYQLCESKNSKALYCRLPSLKTGRRGKRNLWPLRDRLDNHNHANEGELAVQMLAAVVNCSFANEKLKGSYTEALAATPPLSNSWQNHFPLAMCSK